MLLYHGEPSKDVLSSIQSKIVITHIFQHLTTTTGHDPSIVVVVAVAVGAVVVVAVVVVDMVQ